MTLVYRSVFMDADGLIVDAAEGAFGEWLKAKGYEVPDEALHDGLQTLAAPSDVSVTVLRQTSTDADGAALTRFSLVESREDERWVTQATWIQPGSGAGSRGWLRIDLEHQPLAGQPVVRPGSPRFVRELMAAGEATDGVVPLTAEPWRITTAHVPELVRYLTAPGRQVPMLVFASDARRAYDQDQLASRLARDLAGVAAVFQLADGEATQRFADAVPEGYAVYAGALRTFLPGVAANGDEPSRHRILGRASLTALRARAFPAVKDQVLTFSTRRQVPVRGEVDGVRRRRRSHGSASAPPSGSRVDPSPAGPVAQAPGARPAVRGHGSVTTGGAVRCRTRRRARTIGGARWRRLGSNHVDWPG